MSRAIAREQLMNCLFQMDVKQEETLEGVKRYLDLSLIEEDSDKDLKYIMPLLDAYLVSGNKTEVDALISNHLKDWTLDRINRVELAILRLAVLEIKFDETIPYKVSINEAVNLANKFGGDNSGGFVNGVLGEIVRELGL